MHDLSNIAAELLVTVLAMMGQPALQTPHIVAMAPAELQQRACGHPCHVYGWYAPDGTVYLDDRLKPQTNIIAKSILVHELVHHIQSVTRGGPAQNCAEWARREREAFTVQAKWLRLNGVGSGFGSLQARQVKCTAGDAG